MSSKAVYNVCCNTDPNVSVPDNRSAWRSESESCHQKLPFDLWAFMKADGSANDVDAKHVYVECFREPEVGLVELIISEVGVALPTTFNLQIM